MSRYRVPGAAVALVQDGEVTWAQEYGLAAIMLVIATKGRLGYSASTDRVIKERLITA